MTEGVINQTVVEAAIVSAAVIEANIVARPVVDVIVGADAPADPARIVVRDEGTEIIAAAVGLDFVGAGVVITDAGGGVATVTIAGPTAPLLLGGEGTVLGHDPTGFDVDAAPFALSVSEFEGINLPTSPRSNTVYAFGPFGRPEFPISPLWRRVRCRRMPPIYWATRFSLALVGWARGVRPYRHRRPAGHGTRRCTAAVQCRSGDHLRRGSWSGPSWARSLGFEAPSIRTRLRHRRRAHQIRRQNGWLRIRIRIRLWVRRRIWRARR